jgi:uncharacterized protein YjiS (DUF1127 family)
MQSIERSLAAEVVAHLPTLLTYCAAQPNSADDFASRRAIMATIATFLHGLADRYQAWRERERAYAELSALDDRTLADIGVRRSEIEYVISGTHAGEEAFAPADAAAVPVPANANGRSRYAA